MLKQILVTLAAFQFAIPSFALDASAITPFTPDEAVPTNLEEIAPQMTAAINIIASLPPYVASAGAGGTMTIPELPLMRKGLQLYMANRKTCATQQARSATLCREETSPNLQSALQGVNALLAVGNIAVNDNCSTFKKGMTIAQAGLTAYTAACGAMRYMCNTSCDAAASGLKMLAEAVVSNKQTCVDGVVIGTCSAATVRLMEQKNIISEGVQKEAVMKDKRTIHAKQTLCKGTYGLLLASSGLGIVALAKSLAEGQKCDDESSSTGGGSTATAAASTGSSSSTETPSAGTATDSSTTASSSTTATDPSTATDTSSSTTVTTAAPSASDGQYSFSEKSATRETASASDAVRTKSELDDYLPGGTKAAGLSAQTDSHPDITGPGGKSNFEKMRMRFRELGLGSD